MIGRSKSRGRSKSPGKLINVCWKCGKEGHYKKDYRSKSRGISKSPGKPIKVCWKCGKQRHYKKDCRYKDPKKGKGYDDAPSAEGKTTSTKVGMR